MTPRARPKQILDGKKYDGDISDSTTSEKSSNFINLLKKKFETDV